MKSRAKGYRTVVKGRKILESDGWIFDIVEKSGRFRKEKDLFGLFDAIALKPNEKPKFIQFKTNLKGQKWKEPFKDFAKKYPNISVEIWIWFDRKDFEVIIC